MFQIAFNENHPSTDESLSFLIADKVEQPLEPTHTDHGFDAWRDPTEYNLADAFQMPYSTPYCHPFETPDAHYTDWATTSWLVPQPTVLSPECVTPNLNPSVNTMMTAQPIKKPADGQAKTKPVALDFPEQLLLQFE